MAIIISETGLISIVTLGLAFLSAFIGVCYKSKCSRIKLGSLEIDRDVRVELTEDLAEAAARNNNTRRHSVSVPIQKPITRTRSENILNRV